MRIILNTIFFSLGSSCISCLFRFKIQDNTAFVPTHAENIVIKYSVRIGKGGLLLFIRNGNGNFYVATGIVQSHDVSIVYSL